MKEKWKKIQRNRNNWFFFPTLFHSSVFCITKRTNKKNKKKRNRNEIKRKSTEWQLVTKWLHCCKWWMRANQCVHWILCVLIMMHFYNDFSFVGRPSISTITILRFSQMPRAFTHSKSIEIIQNSRFVVTFYCLCIWLFVFQEEQNIFIPFPYYFYFFCSLCIRSKCTQWKCLATFQMINTPNYLKTNKL